MKNVQVYSRSLTTNTNALTGLNVCVDNILVVTLQALIELMKVVVFKKLLLQYSFWDNILHLRFWTRVALTNLQIPLLKNDRKYLTVHRQNIILAFMVTPVIEKCVFICLSKNTTHNKMLV